MLCPTKAEHRKPSRYENKGKRDFVQLHVTIRPSFFTSKDLQHGCYHADTQAVHKLENPILWFSKKPLETIDDLFWRGNYYALLENDPRAVSQQLIVATHPTDSPRGISNKCSNVRIGSREKKEQGREKTTKSPLNWTPMNVTCTIAPDHFSNPRRII